MKATESTEEESEYQNPNFKYLRREILKGARSHSPGTDAFFYNSFTVLALISSTVATVLPRDGFGFWPQITAGFATLLIALLRSLDFGARWRWRKKMKYAYFSLNDQLEMAMNAPSGDSNKEIRAIYDKLVALRGKEDEVPGSGFTPGEVTGGASAPSS